MIDDESGRFPKRKKRLILDGAQDRQNEDEGTTNGVTNIHKSLNSMGYVDIISSLSLPLLNCSINLVFRWFTLTYLLKLLSSNAQWFSV